MDIFGTLDWDLYQRHRIADAQSTAARGEQTALDAQRLAQEMAYRLDRLTLANMALWSLLKEKVGLTEEELVARMREIDLQDGQADGRVRQGLVTCPNCQQALSRKHHRCLYCGYTPEVTEPFSTGR